MRLKPPRTVAERILLQLRNFEKLEESYEYPIELTQDGIADAVGAPRGYVQQLLQELFNLGKVRYIVHHVKGGRKRMKVYRLTECGLFEANSLAEAVEAPDAPTPVAEVGGDVRPVNEIPAPEPDAVDWPQGSPAGGDSTVLKNDHGPARHGCMG
jgi:hypothetical protein